MATILGKRIYLAGPFFGLAYNDVRDWRDTATLLLRERGINTVDPSMDLNRWDGRATLSDVDGGIALEGARKILEADIHQGVLASCGLLVGFPTGMLQTLGTAFELGVAYHVGLPVVLYVPEGVDTELLQHPFIRGQRTGDPHGYHLAHTVDIAVEILATNVAALHSDRTAGRR